MSVTKVTGMMQTGTKGGDIPSASTLVIDTDGDYFDITGTTGITAMTVDAGRRFTLQFDGAVTLTHGSSLYLPGATNFTTEANDCLSFIASAANTVRCTGYALKDGGSPVAAGSTKEFFVPFLYNSESTSSPAYNSNASNFIIAYNDATGEHVHANFHLPADYSSTTAFDIITIPGEAVTTNFNVAVSFGVDDEAASSSSDSVSGLGQSTTNGDIEVYNAINALNTGLAAGDYVGVKCTLASSVAHRFLGCRVKYS